MEGSDWTPAELSLLTTLLRWKHGGTAEKLAQHSGVSRQTIVAYLQGEKKEPRSRTLQRLFAAAAVPPHRVERLRDAVRRVLLLLEPKGEPALEEQVELLARGYAEGLALRIASGLQAMAATLASRTPSVATTWEEERREAPALWARLERYGPAVWDDLVEDCEDFWHSALVELICEKSIQAAADDVDRMLALAQTALKIAYLVQEDEAWRQAVVGYAWAHVGNAFRVANQLSDAEKAFVEAKTCWSAGAVAGRKFLNEARVLGLEASLLRGQRRLPEALEVLDRALAADDGTEAKYLLINRGHLLHVLGEDELALATIEHAARLVDVGREPRLLFALTFDRIVHLCALGRSQEAEERLIEVRHMAERLGQDLYSLRVRWLEGQVAAGAGRLDESARAYERVRWELEALGLPYESALVSAELAAVYLHQDRNAEAKVLAREMHEAFVKQQVHPEATKALKVFSEAARRERLTLELARKMVRYLYRARYDPQLQFVA